jgi:hypothetical protein
VKLKRQLAVCLSFSHSIFGISLSFGISQSFQHLWGCLPDDLAATIKGPHCVAAPFTLPQDCRHLAVIRTA